MAKNCTKVGALTQYNGSANRIPLHSPKFLVKIYITGFRQNRYQCLIIMLVCMIKKFVFKNSLVFVYPKLHSDHTITNRYYFTKFEYYSLFTTGF